MNNTLASYVDKYTDVIERGMLRFHIAKAYYTFFANYHEGQFSDKYKRLSKMISYYKPGRNWGNDPEEHLSLYERGIYYNLVSKDSSDQEEKDFFDTMSKQCFEMSTYHYYPEPKVVSQYFR